MRRLLALVVAGAAALAAGPAAAQPAWAEVVVGVLYQLTGNAAQVGLDSVAAVKTAVEIVNNGVPGLALPLAKGGGLPGLGGAKVRVVVADHQGKPATGQAEAERMITQEKVHALFGAYFSSVTATASQVAERMGVPFLNAESSSPGLTARGFRWFFRTSPHDGHFSQVMFDFLRDLEKKRAVKFRSVAILHEDTLFGSDSAKVQEELARKAGYEVVAKIAYRAQTTSLDAEVQKLKVASADVLLPSSYTSDAVLFVKTAKNLDYYVKLLVAQDAGWTDPSFVRLVGKDAEGQISRAPFALDLAKAKPLVTPVNELFRKQAGGRDLSDVSARAFTGFMVLLDAINRAGSTKPEAIWKALRETNLPPEQLIMPWSGVRFDDTGQNVGVRAILQQLQGGEYHTVYPWEVATAEVAYPLPRWR